MTPRLLLALLVVVWAISWPVTKFGVGVVPPIWFACLRYAIATLILGVLLAARNALRVPRRADWRLIIISGALQMATYSAFTSIALTHLPAGRASVLAFSTPLWVLPLAVWRGQERVSRRGIAGVAVGLAGIVVIALPTLMRSGAIRVAPYVLLVGAALAWAVSLVVVREHRFELDPLGLAPWQTLIAYWAVVEVGRQMAASTLSISMLATPALGLLISAAVLHEPVDAALIVGMALVGGGIYLSISTPSRASAA